MHSSRLGYLIFSLSECPPRETITWHWLFVVAAVSRGRLVHPATLEHIRSLGTREQPYHYPGGVSLLGIGGNSGRISGVVLDFGGKRAGQPDTLHGHDLADLVQPEFSLAAC